jgi:PAS domain S-box-containing protein
MTEDKHSLIAGHAVDDLPGVGSYVWKPASDHLVWSPGLVRLYGLSAPPSVEDGFLSLVHPDDRTRVEAETSAFLESGGTYEHEFRPDGEVRLINDRGVVERGHDGRATALRGLNVDVTAGRGASDLGRLEEVAIFRILADNIDQFAWIADGSGAIYWYNRRWFEFTGTTPEEMRGWGWTKVHHPDHVDRVVSRIRHAFETGTPWEDVFPLRGHEGSYRWFLSRARPIRDRDGRITSWFGTNTDVTEQRAAEAELKLSEERFRLMADTMPQLVWRATQDGDVVYYNRQVTNFAPVRNPATGAFDWTLLLHPDDLDRTGARWNAAADDLSEFSCEHRLAMADGTYRWHLSRAVPVNGSGPGEIVWYGTATDIHELKRIEEHRSLLSDELQHRVKNTLSLVRSMASQTFRSAPNPEKGLEAFNGRLGALARAHDVLVRDEWAEVSMLEICRTSVVDLGFEERTALSGDGLELAPRVGVMMSLALHELCTNASKYGAFSTPDGRVGIRWEALERNGFAFEWRESGVPAVAPPPRRGFGSRILTMALAMEIDGTVDLQFAPGGLVCTARGRAR